MKKLIFRFLMFSIFRLSILLSLLIVPLMSLSLTSCHHDPFPQNPQAKEVSDNFVQALIDKDYHKAYSLTSSSYQKKVTQEQLQKQFENFSSDWRNLNLSTETSDYDFPGDGPFDTYMVIEFVYADDQNFDEHDAIGLNLIKDNERILVNEVEFSARQD